MRISLVIPPSGFLIDERVFPSLGILKVAAVLEQHDVNVIDLSGHKDYVEEFFSQLKEPDYIGFTATTPQLPAAIKLAEAARECTPAKLMIGGPHATLTHAALKKNSIRAMEAWSSLLSRFDHIIVGDGEMSVLAALEEDAPQIIDADNRKSAFFMDNTQYDASPWPARHLIDLESYKYEIEGHKATSLISQLGCPFNCGFCGGRNSHSLRIIRNRTQENVLAEIEMLHEKHGYTGFMFYDDELNVNTGFVSLMEGLSELQYRHNTEFRLRGFIKSELFNEAQAKAMYLAGFRWILCGFEAADDRVLVNINKRATLEDNTRVVEIARKYGLKTKALMSLGHPGDSEDTAGSITDWLIETEVDDFDCTIITPYCGSPYYDEAKPDGNVWVYTAKTGDNLYMRTVDYTTTEDYYKGIAGEYKAYVWTDHASSEDLVRYRDGIEKTVRAELSIDYPGVQSEATMGQTGGVA